MDLSCRVSCVFAMDYELVPGYLRQRWVCAALQRAAPIEMVLFAVVCCRQLAPAHETQLLKF